MTEVKTYCPTWRASVGSSMIFYTWRDTLPDLYVDYHDYKALEAELAEARAQRAHLAQAIENINAAYKRSPDIRARICDTDIAWYIRKAIEVARQEAK